ncbi:MAG: STAS-like domain-containing protein [Spirochaetota bacterium]
MREITISVFNIVGNPFCVDAEDGEKVYSLLKKALNEDQKIKISFQNVEMLTSAFLNTAIGQVYRDFKEDIIKSNLSVEYLSPEDMALLKRVNSTAKLYYKNPERMQNSIDEILGE